MKRNSLLIYLAGKVDGKKHEIAKGNASEDVRFVCSDGGQHSEHGWGFGYYNFVDCIKLREHFVHDYGLRQLNEADMLFAFFDSPDSFGSIAEIAYFSALGKPSLVTVLTAEGSPIDDPMYDAYWFVCCFPGVKVREVRSLDDAARTLREYLSDFAWMASLLRGRRARVE